jgi:hypothetical protein
VTISLHIPAQLSLHMRVSRILRGSPIVGQPTPSSYGETRDWRLSVAVFGFAGRDSIAITDEASDSSPQEVLTDGMIVFNGYTYRRADEPECLP